MTTGHLWLDTLLVLVPLFSLIVAALALYLRIQRNALERRKTEPDLRLSVYCAEQNEDDSFERVEAVDLTQECGRERYLIVEVVNVGMMPVEIRFLGLERSSGEIMSRNSPNLDLKTMLGVRQALTCPFPEFYTTADMPDKWFSDVKRAVVTTTCGLRRTCRNRVLKYWVAHAASVFKELQEREYDRVSPFKREREAAEQEPNNAEKWCELGEAALKAHDLTAAGSAFRQALELDPGSSRAANGIARHNKRSDRVKRGEVNF